MSRIIVVGGSLGGLRAVEALYARGWDGEIVVVSEERHPPYTRPPLSKAALCGEPDLQSLLFKQRPEAIRAEWLWGTSAVAANLSERTVELSTGETIDYAGLVAATGVRARRLGGTDGEIGHVVRTFDDCVSLHSRLVPGARLVVIGAGFIGCEVAATAITLGCRVDVVAIDEVPMAVPLGVAVGGAIQRRHERAGVRFHLGTGVAGIDRAGEETDAGWLVRLTDGDPLACDVLVQAVGSAPAVGWLERNGLDLTDGVVCDNDLRIEGHSGTVAVGDVARFPNPFFDEVPRRVEHWQMPMVTAVRAATTLMTDLVGAPQPEAPFTPLPSFWSDQLDMRIQSFGSLGIADRVEVIDGDLHSDSTVGYYRGDSLVGALLLGSPKKAPAVMRMVSEALSAARA